MDAFTMGAVIFVIVAGLIALAIIQGVIDFARDVAALFRVPITIIRGAHALLRRLPLRWRLRLRMHPGPGFASRLELRSAYGTRGPRKEAARLRPSLAARLRPLTRISRARVRPHEYATFLGRAGWRRKLWVGLEEGILIFGVPRSGKSQYLAALILNAPGTVVATSLRGDLIKLTARFRSSRGPVHFFDPANAGGQGHTFMWAPIAGAEDSNRAIARATALTSAVQSDDVKNSSYWAAAAARWLQSLLHAAAIGNHTMADVYRWALDDEDATPIRVLETTPGAFKPFITTLRKSLALPEDQRKSVQDQMLHALGFMADKGIAAAMDTHAGQQADIDDLVTTVSTLYLVGDDQAHSAVAPLFACLLGEIRDRARVIAEQRATNRLDPPLSMVLDEVGNLAPVPLKTWSASASGSGILLFPAVQSPADLRVRWGEDEAEAIEANFTTRMVFGALGSPGRLDGIAALCGTRRAFATTTSTGSDGVLSRTRAEVELPVATATDVRRLPRGYALILHRAAAATVVRVPQMWRQRVKRAFADRPAPQTPPAEHTTPAAEPPTPPAAPEPEAESAVDRELRAFLSAANGTSRPGAGDRSN